MKAARAESTRRALACPAAHAVGIPLNGKRGNARKAAPAVGTGGATVSLGVSAEGMRQRTISTPRSSAPRRWRAGEPGSASTCVSSANSTRRSSARSASEGGIGSAATASNTAMESPLSSGTTCSKSRAGNAICVTSRWRAHTTSTTITHAVLESAPAGHVFAVSLASCATKGLASSAMTRSVCAGSQTTWKRPTRGCVKPCRLQQRIPDSRPAGAGSNAPAPATSKPAFNPRKEGTP